MMEQDELDDYFRRRDQVVKASSLAREAHEGQVDKLGERYMSHVGRVMSRFDVDDQTDAKTVAALHDIVEDTDVSLDDLRAKGFPTVVVEAVDALTRRDGESYEAFLDRVAANPLACLVKAADLYDNSNEERLSRLPTDVADRLRVKYTDAIARLGVGEQIDRWRNEGKWESAVVNAVLDPTSEGADQLVSQATAHASFRCAVCDAVAGTLILVGAHLAVIGSVGSGGFRVRPRSVVAVGEAITERDLAALRSVDTEYAPFWCKTCRHSFCRDHWEPLDVTFDDGFYDATYGTCPNGHRQKVDD